MENIIEKNIVEKNNLGTRKILRNNTNFPNKITEFLKKSTLTDEYQFLKYYQWLVREYILKVNSGARGILINHAMGLGKTMTAISIAMELYEEYPVIVLLTKSLQENFRENIRKYIKMRSEHDPLFQIGRLPAADIDAFIEKNYSFVNMNAGNMITQLARASEGFAGKEFDKMLNKKIKKIIDLGSLDNKLIIVDEAHNLFRAIINGSENAIKFYDMTMIARNLKLIFLTGTPISTNPFQLVPCFNMLGVDENKQLPLLPELFVDFQRLYIDDTVGIKENDNVNAKHIKNKNKFQNRIMGLISYIDVSALSGGSDNTKIDLGIPEELPLIVMKLPMDNTQYALYTLAREGEKEEGKRSVVGKSYIRSYAALTLPKSGKGSSYRVRSRHLSNYCPPIEFRDMKFSEIDVEQLPNAKVDSPKLRAVLEITKKYKSRTGILYSQFIGVGGLKIISRYLTLHGWTNWQNKSVIGGDSSNTTSCNCIGDCVICACCNGGGNILGNTNDHIHRSNSGSKSSSGLSKMSLVPSCGCKNINMNFSREANNTVFVHYKRPINGTYIVNPNITYEWSEATTADINNIKKLDIEKRINKNKDYKNCIVFPNKIILLKKIESSGAKLLAYATIKYKKDKINLHNISVEASEKELPQNANCAQSMLFEIIYSSIVGINFVAKLYKTCPFYNTDYKLYDSFGPTKVINSRNKPNRVKLLFSKNNTIVSPNNKKLIDYFNKCSKDNSGHITGGAAPINKSEISDNSADDPSGDLADDLNELNPLSAVELPKTVISKYLDKKSTAKCYAVISGETTQDELNIIISVFNSPENKHGGYIDLLLISASGAEGLDLKNGAYAIAFEPYWNYSRISQFISRIVRLGSHLDMPKNERQVQPYLLLTIPPVNTVDSTNVTNNTKNNPAKNNPEEILTTDVELYLESVKQHQLNTEFLTALKEVSIECLYNAQKSGNTANCRTCLPNDEILFTWDPVMDISSKDNCSAESEHNITAMEIKLNDVSYYYNKSVDSIYGYIFYEYDGEISAYRRVEDNSELFNTLLELVENNSNKK